MSPKPIAACVQGRRVILAGDFDEETLKSLRTAEAPADAIQFDREVE